MAQHPVICVNCGKQFDANRGGYYNRSTKRYTCKACANAAKKRAAAVSSEKKAVERQAATGTRQSKTAMIIKIAVGALFILCSPSMSGVAETLLALAVGAALIAWGLIPYFRGKKELKRREEEKAAADRYVANLPRTCPRCGANTKGDVCEFCGSPLN